MENSVSFDNVLILFTQACHDKNLQNQQSAMKQIQDFENYNNYIDSIIQIIASTTTNNNTNVAISKDIRLLCVITLKNIVNRCWKSRGNNYRILTNNEKQLLKQFVIQYIDINNDKLNIQLIILASKIARYDWPDSWPSLFSDLFTNIHTTHNILLTTPTIQYKQHKHNLLLLYNIYNEIISKHIPTINIHIQNISLEIFKFLYPLWLEYCKLFLDIITNIISTSSTSVDSKLLFNSGILIENIVIITYILNCTLIKGYKNIYNNIDMYTFYTSYILYLKEFINIVRLYYTNNPPLLHIHLFNLNPNNSTQKGQNSDLDADNEDFDDNNDNNTEDDDLFALPSISLLLHTSCTITMYYNIILLPILHIIIKTM